MNAEAAVAVRSWPVGRYTCELRVQRPKAGAVGSAVVAWSPSEPKRLTMTEWAEYRAGRDQVLDKIAVELGLNVRVLEL